MSQLLGVFLAVTLGCMQAAHAETDLSGEIAEAKEAVTRRQTEWRAAGVALHRRMQADPSWAAAHDRFQNAAAALRTARKQGDEEARRSGEAELYRTQRELLRIGSRIRESDTQYQSAWDALNKANDALRELEERRSRALDRPSTRPTTAAAGDD